MMRRFSSSVVRSTSVTCSVQVLPTTVHTGVCASTSARMLASSSGRALRAAGGAEGGDHARVRHGMSRARSKNSASFGFEPGQPPSMKATPELVEPARDAELVVAGERDALALRAVAQGRVVDLDHARSPGRLAPASKAAISRSKRRM